MQTTEQDIFNYVLFPEEIAAEKKEYIKANESLYKEQIDFCKSFLNFDNERYPEIKTDKIADEILDKIRVIALYPVSIDEKLSHKQISLVGATTQTANKFSESITFMDENSKYLIRIVRDKNANKLYFFHKEVNPNFKLKFTIIPSNEIFHIKSPAHSFDITSADIIQKILIEEE